LQGAKEIDIVYSGLEEIIGKATMEHWQLAQQKNMTLRDACIGNSLKKLADRIEYSGIMQ